MPKNNCQLLQKLSNADLKDIQAFAVQRVGPQEAEDLVQDAYLHLLQRAEKDEVRQTRAFLFGVIANLSIDAWRKSKRKISLETECDVVEMDNFISPHPGPESLTNSLLAFERFLSILDELPVMQRHAFVLNKLEGLNHAQIAKRLGVSTKSIQRYLVDALEHFALHLEDYSP